MGGQRRAGAPDWLLVLLLVQLLVLLGAHAARPLAVPALLTALWVVASSPPGAQLVAAAAVGAGEGGVVVMAQAAAGHPAAAAVGLQLSAAARVLDVQPGQGALQGAEGLVHVRACRVQLSVVVLLRAEGQRRWGGAAVTSGLLQVPGSVPQLIGHRQLGLVGPLRVVELTLDTICTLLSWRTEERGSVNTLFLTNEL